MSEILKLIITALGASIVTVVGSIITFNLQRKAKKEDDKNVMNTRLTEVEKRLAAMEKQMDLMFKRMELLERADLSLLRERLFYNCKAHIRDGFITVDDMEEIDALYASYTALNGNGTGTKLYNDVKRLPLKT